MSLASISSLVLCFWIRPEAYPKAEHLKGASLGLALALITNIRLALERIAKDEHLWGPFVSYK